MSHPRTLTHWQLGALGLVAIAALIAPPLIGWPEVVRLSAVLTPLLLLAVAALKPWRWREADWENVREWQPSPRHVALGAMVAGAVLSWIVLTRFQGGHINGVDFTVYFDRPLFQTSRGRLFLVETTDDLRFSHLSHLAVHAYWALLPLSALYLLVATPIWLLALSVIAVVMGAVHVLRIAQHIGAGGVLGSAAALSFMLNDHTAGTLNYGFHPEVLYAWFLPWLLDAGLRGHRRSFLAAAIACVLVKEDAVLPLFASAVALALVCRRSLTTAERVLFLVVPTALALANLALFYGYVVTAMAPGGAVMYAYFWTNYGATPLLALRGMLMQPWRVVLDTLTSGLVPTVMPPFLFLPLIGWRWFVGVVPILLIYGASANPQVRAFGIYYPIVLVPFLVVAACFGATVLTGRMTRRAAGPAVAALVLVLGSLLVGRGYTVRPWRPEVAAVPPALELLADELTVLVQSGLYPHAGYESRAQILTPDTLTDPANAEAAILLADGISAYPFSPSERAELLRLPRIAPMPNGLVAVRRTPKSEGARPRVRSGGASAFGRRTMCARRHPPVSRYLVPVLMR